MGELVVKCKHRDALSCGHHCSAVALALGMALVNPVAPVLAPGPGLRKPFGTLTTTLDRTGPGRVAARSHHDFHADCIVIVFWLAVMAGRVQPAVMH